MEISSIMIVFFFFTFTNHSDQPHHRESQETQTVAKAYWIIFLSVLPPLFFSVK